MDDVIFFYGILVNIWIMSMVIMYEITTRFDRIEKLIRRWIEDEEDL